MNWTELNLLHRTREVQLISRWCLQEYQVCFLAETGKKKYEVEEAL